MPVSFREIDLRDLQEPGLTFVNDILNKLAAEVNRLGGNYGSILIQSNIDMGGFRIINLGDAVDSGDGVSKSYADDNYGGSAVRAEMEATGQQVLKTARRLNDSNQREAYSTFLNNTGGVPVYVNDSTVSVAAAGANSDITVTAGTVNFQDGKSTIPFSGVLDTVANPGVGSDVYYYYFDLYRKQVAKIGPYSTDTANNRLQANTDGRVYIGVATVNAGGGGTGGGGANPWVDGGCAEVGSRLEFYPDAEPSMEVLECADWVTIIGDNGLRLRVARGTFVSVFVRAEELYPGMRLELKNGKMSPVIGVDTDHAKGFKMKVKEPANGTYFANGVRVHNAKA